jgi:hypothetical protein
MVCPNPSGNYQGISSNQATTVFFHILSMHYFLISLSQNAVIRIFVALETCTQEVRAFKLDQVSDCIEGGFYFLSPVPSRRCRHITPNYSKTLPPTFGLRTDRYISLCYRPVVLMVCFAISQKFTRPLQRFCKIIFVVLV